MILEDIHEKCGLRVNEDDHILTLRHNWHVIARYPTTGPLSRNEIRHDADEYIVGLVKKGGQHG